MVIVVIYVMTPIVLLENLRFYPCKNLYRDDHPLEFLIAYPEAFCGDT